MGQMLQAAAGCSQYRYLELLLELPAAQQLSSSCTAQALEAVLVAEQHHCVRLLCKLPAAEELDELAVAALLQAAVQIKCDGCVRALRQLPGAYDMAEEAVMSLVHAALQLKLPACLAGPSGSAGLLSLPAAQSFSSSTIDAMLHAAVQAGCTCAAPLLCGLPAKPSCEVLEVTSVMAQHTAADEHPAGHPCNCAQAVLELLQAATPADITAQLAGEMQHAAPASSSGNAVLVGLLTSGLPVDVLQQLLLPEVCCFMQAAEHCSVEGVGCFASESWSSLFDAP